PPLRNLVLPPLAPHPPSATLFPYTTLFRSDHAEERTAGARPEDVESLAQVSLPTSAQASVPAQYDQVRQAWIISGPNPNLRIVGNFGGPVQAGAIGFGFLVSVLQSFVQVARVQGRHVLRDGHHRAI